VIQSQRPFWRSVSWLALQRPIPICLILTVLAALAGSSVVAETSPPASGVLSLGEYRARLHALDQLLVSCQQARTAAHCSPDAVGPDLKVAAPSGERPVRLAWLRDLLSRAGQNQPAKSPAPEKAKPQSRPAGDKPEYVPPTLTQQLEDARQRLAADDAFAEELAPTAASSTSSLATGAATERQVLTRILAGKEYHAAVAQPSLMHRVLEKVVNWIDRFLAKLQQAGFQSQWIGLAAEIGFILLVSIALVWFLIRMERQGRLGSGSFLPETAAGAASARDWQLWLEDAREAAQQGAWRDAIHFLYWANISRLESGGLWPADRARTPREYLALLPLRSAQRAGLATLTRSFERTWYAGRPAQEADFRQAEQTAAQLGAQLGAQLKSRPLEAAPPGSATPSSSPEAQ
jgi:hypothetical protein